MFGGCDFIPLERPRQRSRRISGNARFVCPLAAICLLLLPTQIRAQDPIRFSFAGETASRARPKYVIPPNAFLRTGPLSFTADLQLGAEFNDNINLSDKRGATPPQSDFILRPRLNVRTNLLLSPLNSLDIDLGVGLEHYLTHSDRNQRLVSIAPGSEIRFNVFVGDFRFSFYDRFSLQHNPVSQATVNNASEFGVFSNTAGLNVLWDLNQFVLTAGYDHLTSISTVSTYENSDLAQDAFSVSASVPLTGSTSLGVRATYALSDYTFEGRPDAESLSIGPFIEAQLTNYTRASAFAGFRRYAFTSPSSFSLQSPSDVAADAEADKGSFFIYFTLINRLNSKMSHSLTFTRESRLGFSATLEEVSEARYAFGWKINRRFDLGLELFYEHLVEKGSIQDETLNRLGATLTLSVQLVRDTALRLFYRGTQKDSNLQFQDYQQNAFGIDLRYTF